MGIYRSLKRFLSSLKSYRKKYMGCSNLIGGHTKLRSTELVKCIRSFWMPMSQVCQLWFLRQECLNLQKSLKDIWRIDFLANRRKNNSPIVGKISRQSSEKYIAYHRENFVKFMYFSLKRFASEICVSLQMPLMAKFIITGIKMDRNVMPSSI